MIKQRLDDYLEFDSNEFFENTDFLEIFGGAIRDSIANLEIHDVDILCMKESALKASEILESHGYKNVTYKISTKDIQQMYKDIHCIFEPWTFMNSNLKIVQLIRPVIVKILNNFRLSKNDFFNTMKEVDISCCGVSWDGKKINENYPNAIKHCKERLYSVNTNANMYNKDRIFDRKWKLNNRGWICLDDMSKKDYMIYLRKQKLDRVLYE